MVLTYRKVITMVSITKGFKQMANTDGPGKYIATGVIGALVTLSVTFFTGVSSNKTEIRVLEATLTEKIQTLQKSVENGMVDRYKGADAAKDNALTNQRLAAIEEHISENNQELKEHIRNHPK